ncbi:MAG: lipid-A-disaccharide synthase [Planctomycetota bacterium]
MGALPSIEVAAVLCRELLRALAAPLHVLAFLPRRTSYLAESCAALDRSATAEVRDDARQRFVAAHAGRCRRIFVSCGETSGETHLLHLIDAVRTGCSDEGRDQPTWIGFGGQRLARAGVDSRFPLAEHAVMGLGGVLRSIPLIVRAFATFLHVLRAERPDLVVLVDYPGLHLVFAEAARRRGIPVVHYVAPQYWAWGPWRMRRYRRAVDATLTILPFEPAFFGDRELASGYVGHPLLDELASHPPSEASLAAVRARPTLVLMPGSRRKEIALHLAPMVALATALQRDRTDLRVVIPHRDPGRAALIRTRLAELPDGERVEVQEGDPGPWLRGARAVLAKSGTGSLEACLHGTPTVVVYVLSGRFARFVRHRLLTVPWFAAANLCAGKCIVPEFAVERPGDWDAVARAVAALEADGEARGACLENLDALRVRLGPAGASARAATWIVPLCPTHGSHPPTSP